MRAFVCLVGVLVLAAAVSAQEDGVAPEMELISVLESDAAWVEKQEACRGLRRVGTAKAVPALAGLLNDPKLSHMARYALEPMPAPEAGAALRDALDAVEGALKTGIVSSLGIREDAAAVPLLKPLLGAEESVGRAAALALGRIGTPDALDALLKADVSAPPWRGIAVAEGLLAAGQQLHERGDNANAVKAFNAIAGEDWPAYIRVGAFRGLALADADPARVLAALGGDDPLFRDTAADIVGSVNSDGNTAAYTAGLRDLPEAGQVALLRGLAARGDSGAREAVLEAAAGGATTVRIAAIGALMDLGTKDDVGFLASLLSDEALSGAAANALRQLSANGTDTALEETMKTVDPATRAQLVTLLADRIAPRAPTVAREWMSDSALEVRIAALNTLQQLGGEPSLAVVLAALRNPETNIELQAAGKAIGQIAGRVGPPAVGVIEQALKHASPEEHAYLLRALGRIGSSEALALVKPGLSATNARVREAALDVVSNWPTVAAADILLELANADDATRHDAGLRGYVRLAREERDTAKKEAMLRAIAPLARSKQEQWQVLSAWGTLATPEALDALTPYLKDPEVRREAVVAIVQVAEQLAGAGEDAKARALATLETVQSMVDDRDLLKRVTRARLKLRSS